MIADVIRQLTKIKKKHGDQVQVIYIHDNHSELSISNLSKVDVCYTTLTFTDQVMTPHEFNVHADFISVKEFEALEDKSKYKPVAVIMEND